MEYTLKEVMAEFGKVHARIDGCEKSISALDKTISNHQVANGIRREVEEKHRDYWLWINRCVSVSCIIAVIGFVVTKIIIPHLGG